MVPSQVGEEMLVPATVFPRLGQVRTLAQPQLGRGRQRAATLLCSHPACRGLQALGVDPHSVPLWATGTPSLAGPSLGNRLGLSQEATAPALILAREAEAPRQGSLLGKGASPPPCWAGDRAGMPLTLG